MSNAALTNLIRRARRGLDEISYANRRSFELRTGISADVRPRPLTGTVEELERLYRMRPRRV